MRLKVLLALAAAAIAVWACYSATGSAGEAKQLGPAPEVTIGALPAGKHVSLSSMKGHVVLVDFWGTWCGPCRLSIPALEKLYEQRHAKGLDVLGVALEEDGGRALPTAVRALGITYPVGMPTARDGVEETMSKYGGGAVPLLVIVDRKGMVRGTMQGYDPTGDDRLREQVDALLAE